MDDVHLLSSSMMGQLVILQKRVLQHDGALRLCGLSPQCQEALHLCRLDRVMPNFYSREDAVHGCARSKPR
jgi:anti-anti-sigma factor